MAQSGERGNWQGEIFDHACGRLLTQLGFKVVFRGKYGIDMLAATPTGSPAPFLPPPPLPPGNIAFEFTSQFEGAPTQTEELAQKIEEARKRRSYQIHAGVVLCDVRVPEKQFPSSGHVYLWDVRDASLLVSKIVTTGVMRAKGGTPLERAFKDSVTYLWCLETKAGFHKAQAVLYEHRQTGDMSSDDLEATVDDFCSRVESEVVPLGLYPLQVEISMRSRMFTTKGVEERLDSLLQERSHEDRVVYTSAGLISFFVAPWSFGCGPEL